MSMRIHIPTEKYLLDPWLGGIAEIRDCFKECSRIFLIFIIIERKMERRQIVPGYIYHALDIDPLEALFVPASSF